MQRLLPAILLCAGVQSALAATAVQPPRAPDTIVQAQLLVPNDPAAGARAGREAAKPKADAARQEQEEHGPAGMLLAALALMTGIALRRWGQGDA